MGVGSGLGSTAGILTSGRTHFADVCLRAVGDVDVAGLRVKAGGVLPDEWCDEHVEEIVQLLEAGTIEAVPVE